MHIVIVGCGRVGAELIKLLSNEGHNVVIIDKDESAFKRLGRAFNGLSLVGNGFDVDILKHAGIEKADVFCALTDADNTNLVAAQAAKRIFKVPKVIARVYDPEKAHIYEALGLDILSGTILFAAMIRDKIIESRFSGYLIESKDVGVIEIDINGNLEGRRVSALNVPREFLIIAIKNIEGVIIPDPNTILKKGDTILGLVKTESLDVIRKRFRL
jgi:trk system potassium uptake protein TrkA